jgi:hypothetical protein
MWVFWLVAVCLFLLAGLWRRSVQRDSLPQDQISRTSDWADESSCVSCHVQAETFWSTGHARTLQPARGAESLSRLRELSQPGLQILFADSTEVASNGSESSNPIAIDHESSPPREVRLDWCFGSGEHACTWAGLLPDSWGMTDLLEFRWSWYAQTKAFELTPGQSLESGPGYFQHLGMLFDQPKARHCFACHASIVPATGGRIDSDAIHPGVTCQRCHGHLGAHVSSDGTEVPQSLKSLSRDESMRRCAQCHRSADEQRLEEIRPDHAELVRFQPVGLAQSACFQHSPEMNCMTCHDPHRPLSAQDSRGIWQCLQCHDPKQPTQTPCSAGRTDDCLSCHMPEVSLKAPLAFTDHWIRLPDQKRTAP